MRKLLISAALILLAMPAFFSPAGAQPGRHQLGGGRPERAQSRHQASPEPAPRRAGGRLGYERGSRGAHADRRASPATAAPNCGARDRGAHSDRQARPDRDRDRRGDARSLGYRGPRRDFQRFRFYHRNHRAAHRFRAPYYRRPYGWYAHRWTFGEFLPLAFWTRNYWIYDYLAYDLPPPPFGAAWVRVGNDALLVDDSTGEIIAVEYGVFY